MNFFRQKDEDIFSRIPLSMSDLGYEVPARTLLRKMGLETIFSKPFTINYGWFQSMNKKRISFVTRAKTTMAYKVTGQQCNSLLKKKVSNKKN